MGHPCLRPRGGFCGLPLPPSCFLEDSSGPLHRCAAGSRVWKSSGLSFQLGQLPQPHSRLRVMGRWYPRRTTVPSMHCSGDAPAPAGHGTTVPSMPADTHTCISWSGLCVDREPWQCSEAPGGRRLHAGSQKAAWLPRRSCLLLYRVDSDLCILQQAAMLLGSEGLCPF